ncbi:hypothetical protein ACFWYW_57930 [Nonomuraea sp. NPDC059023]|uniref:hypothetical protein n=1 Tax=unclassified Nonomuraea TaxID=2593643 RepID=UPI0036C743A5
MSYDAAPVQLKSLLPISGTCIPLVRSRPTSPCSRRIRYIVDSDASEVPSSSREKYAVAGEVSAKRSFSTARTWSRPARPGGPRSLLAPIRRRLAAGGELIQQREELSLHLDHLAGLTELGTQPLDLRLQRVDLLVPRIRLRPAGRPASACSTP